MVTGLAVRYWILTEREQSVKCEYRIISNGRREMDTMALHLKMMSLQPSVFAGEAVRNELQ